MIDSSPFSSGIKICFFSHILELDKKGFKSLILIMVQGVGYSSSLEPRAYFS